MKKYIIAILVLGLFSCNQTNKGSDLKALTIPDTTYTSGTIALNISGNEYATVTLQRIVMDTAQLVTTDSSGGKITQEKKVVRDTSYRAWWPSQIPDSTKTKPLKSKVDPTRDSIEWRFRFIEKKMVLQDYNRNWDKN